MSTLKRWAKLLSWLSKRYPEGHIDFYESDETVGFNIWDKKENKDIHDSLAGIYCEQVKHLPGAFKHDDKLYGEWLGGEKEMRRKHLKFSLCNLNDR